MSASRSPTSGGGGAFSPQLSKRASTATSREDDARLSSSLGQQPPPSALQATPSPARVGSQRPKVQLPKTPQSSEWPVNKIVEFLTAYAKDVRRDHSRLVAYVIDNSERWRPPGQQYRSSVDVFADVKPATALKEAKKDTIKIKLKVSPSPPASRRFGC